MISYLSFFDIIQSHKVISEEMRGFLGIRDSGLLKSAIAQPKMMFDGIELYPTVPEKASALCFSLIMNHPFVDGNKRTAHAATKLFLEMNGWKFNASRDDARDTMMALASNKLSRDEFTSWVQNVSSPNLSCERYWI